MHHEIQDIFTTIWIALRMNSARTLQGSKIKYKISRDKEAKIIKGCVTTIKRSGRIQHPECILVLNKLLENPRDNFIVFNKLMED